MANVLNLIKFLMEIIMIANNPNVNALPGARPRTLLPIGELYRVIYL